MSERPILAAVGGRGESPLAFAALLAGASGVGVRVVSAVEPPVPLDPYMGAMSPSLDAAPWMREARAAVERELARAGVADAGWPVDVVVGEPSRRLAAHARETDARLVLLGRPRHGRTRTRYASGLALRLLRLAPVPVLSVAPSLAALPRRVVVGVDFSPYSAHAARVALAVAAPDAAVHLVHVRPREGAPLRFTDSTEPPYDEAAVAEAWSRFHAAVGDVGGRRVETATIVGDPTRALADHVRDAEADLVATGTHGRGFLDRLVLGSVAESLLQHAPCSVLCVPGSAAARAEHRRLAIAGLRTRSVPAPEWDEALATITQAAAGRTCSVEVHHPEHGAQQLVEGLPFAGASHDRHEGPDGQEGRLVLTFGIARGHGAGPRDLVLTHAVPGLTALDVVTDAEDVVHVIRAETAQGQTLVTFTD